MKKLEGLNRHTHEHHHHLEESCGCGHEHADKQIYLLENLGCAHCASQMTGKIAKQNVVFARAVKALVMILGFFEMANMWMAVFADTGVAMLCILNSIRILYKKD